ncbi:MAG: nuclear transport factor 2 family protein [Afipia sp.]
MSSSAAAKIAPSSSWKDLATRYNAAWNAHDVAAIMAFHADDTSYQRHGNPKVYKGKDVVAEQFGKDISGLPGIKFEPVALYGSDDHFVSESILTATTPDGKPVTMELVDVITLRDGKVVHKSSYFVQSRPPKA